MDHFKFRKKRYDVIDRVVLGRKTYLFTKQLSSGPRRRYLAFDPVAGPGGALRIVQLMENSGDAWQRVGVLQRLSQHNPELPQILEFHRLKGEIGTVETWLEGNDLRWWIRKMRSSDRQRLGTPESLRLFRQLAHALHHLHRHCGVVHADIKPANIIVNNRSRRLALIDFGSAWNVERTNRRHHGDGRSDIYSAPEVLTNRTGVDFRADYFSLAAVCFETLALQPPYDGLGGRAGLPEYEDERGSLYVPPSELSREKDKLARFLWAAIDQLFAATLSLEPGDRPANGNDWLARWDAVVDQLQTKTSESLASRLLASVMNWMNRP
ncbi:protein kinase [bacterium]|nr:protein kinase [bacterium]